jgi:deoxyadenosine/deoxycytidine kinase
MINFVEPPDLLIYLKADIPKLVQQISKRNRDFEFNIKLEYLKNLNEHYEKWISTYKHRLLTIDVNNLDYVARIEDFSLVVGKVDFELNNLFS